MKWTQLSPYCIQSGPYTVTKNHTASGWLYAAIVDKRILATGTAAECKSACQSHAK